MVMSIQKQSLIKMGVISSFKEIISASGARLIAFISFSLGFSGLLLGYSAWNVWGTYETFDISVEKQAKLQGLSDQIVYLDEVLTMSARMYASTGDLKWQERYYKFVPELDITIKHVIELAPDAYKSNAKKIDEANLKLVDLEVQSFQLVRKGRAPQALKILLGSEYETLKQGYAKGISVTLDAIHLDIETSISSYRQLLLQTFLLRVLSFFILGITTIIIVWQVIRYTKERNLAQTQLQQTNKKLSVLNEELARITHFKDEFLANMSHEIRTPMNAIIGMNYLILKTELTIHQRNYLEKAQIASHHLLGLINEILDFSKIEAGKLTLEQVDFELEKVLENVATLISEKASIKGLEIIFDIDRDLPRNFIGDPLRLGQILTNYASNAVKFTEKGEITLIVRLEEYREEEVVLYMAVKDTGIGLKEEEMKLLFHSFQQADSSTTRKFGGTGLGLAISKRIVELMGGEVGVESEFGKGSTFWFTGCLGKSTTTRRRIFSGDIAGKLVLVVDDNENARLILKDLLEQLKFEVDMVDSGQAALAAIAEADTGERPYEIIFLDWKMPSMDGIEVARQMKMLPLKHKPHHLLITAYGREEVVASAETIGIDTVLLKPINASTLTDTLAKVLSGDRMDSSTNAFAASIVIWSDRLKPVRGSKILLVEDDEVNQEVAIGLLKEAGLVVDVADNGLIAVEKVRSNDYALVLMDMQMPEMDGVTATVEIRKDPRYQSLPIVAMTANVMQGDRDKCFAAGMNDHVAKPIEPDELGKALLKWIPPNSSHSDIPDPSASVKESIKSEEAIALPANISGLNISEGLRRVIAKRSLYLSMLRKFVAGQTHFADQFNQAIEVSDFHLAERLAHTLKGVAGNIGAEVIAEAAAALETGLRHKASGSEVELLLIAVQRPLKSLIDALESQLPPELVSVDLANIDWTDLEQVCQRLTELLLGDDAEAVEFLQDHADLLRSAFPNNYNAIASGINAFDFDTAHAALILAIEILKKHINEL
jgi:two-component system sensor histidine kinase/response regulator